MTEQPETRRAEEVENKDVADLDPDRDVDEEAVVDDEEGDRRHQFGDDPQDLQGDDPASGGS